MRFAKRLGLVLLAACAFSAVPVSAASAAPTFLSHPAGLLLAKTDNVQRFTTAAGAIECTAVKLLPPDTTTTLQFLSVLVGIQYEKCKAFGLTATVDPFRYVITAHGLVSLETSALILAIGCTVTVPAAKNQNLEKLEFDNNNGGVLILAKVNLITSFGEGAACTYAEEEKGVYEGNVHVSVEGGVFRWDK